MKTNLTINWLTTPFFTLDELQSANPNVKNITLRVRFQKEREAGKYVEIGCKMGGQGRPKKVFAATPVPPLTLEAAKAKNIVLVEQNQLQKLGTVPAISPTSTAPTTAAIFRPIAA